MQFTKYEGIYIVFLIRLAAVSAAAGWLIHEGLAVGSLVAAAIADTGIQWMVSFLAEAEKSRIDVVLAIIGGVLVWWRVVKVFVIHGFPITLGVATSDGKENGGDSGRFVTISHIGDIDIYKSDGSFDTDYEGPFWYGAVFRAHPRSDKMVRTRLEYLVMGFPFGVTISVHESRWFLRIHDHSERAERFRRVMDKYYKWR